MKRTVIKIDENICNGCGACVTGCHEGALQLIDGKARLISDLFCDGLGACIGECPVNAITFEEREAVAYDEIAVIERMIPKGENTILAHLKHLMKHGETVFLKQAIDYINAYNININLKSLINVNNNCKSSGSACPGSREMTFTSAADNTRNMEKNIAPSSQLRQWPVQLHLLNPEAQYFKKADVVLAADCVAYSFADFHNRFLAGKTLAIACPKLDNNADSYIEKLQIMINNSHINTLTVVQMEVPCCGKLLQLAWKAIAVAEHKIPLKLVVIGIEGNIIKEEWMS